MERYVKYFCLSLIFITGALLPELNAQTSDKVDKSSFLELITTDPSVQLVDVRTPQEYAAGHIHSAVNMDYQSTDFAQQLTKLDKTKPIAVYCASGRRSGLASDELRKLGFKKVYDLEGGIKGWQAAGFPVEK